MGHKSYDVETKLMTAEQRLTPGTPTEALTTFKGDLA